MILQNGIKWKKNMQCAAALTFELDGETFWLSHDSTNIKRPKTLSIGTYGIKRGLPRILSLLDAYGLKATFFIPGYIAEKYPEQVKDVFDRGHEIGNHGYLHENFALLSLDEQRDALRKGSESLERVTGEKPVGFRAPEGEITWETLKLVEDMGFVYSSCLKGDDRPNKPVIHNKAVSIIDIPTHWELNDMPLFGFNYYPPFPVGQCRPASPQAAMSTWSTEFEGYYREGLLYVLTLHPQFIGTPGRTLLLKKLFDFMGNYPSIWFATCKEIAQYSK